MFEHDQLNGTKFRLVDASEGFIASSILECREGSETSSPRRQYTVKGDVLVERYLPAESQGDAWPHDASASPWWNVVDHPPHAGIVAEFNEFQGGIYKRKLDPEKNVVAYAGEGEDVVMDNGVYKVVRASDGKEFEGPSLLSIRNQYYS